MFSHLDSFKVFIYVFYYEHVSKTFSKRRAAVFRVFSGWGLAGRSARGVWSGRCASQRHLAAARRRQVCLPAPRLPPALSLSPPSRTAAVTRHYGCYKPAARARFERSAWYTATGSRSRWARPVTPLSLVLCDLQWNSVQTCASDGLLFHRRLLTVFGSRICSGAGSGRASMRAPTVLIALLGFLPQVLTDIDTRNRESRFVYVSNWCNRNICESNVGRSQICTKGRTVTTATFPTNVPAFEASRSSWIGEGVG